MTQIPTPADVLDYWLGNTPNSVDGLEEKHKLWFGKSQETDAEIRKRFGELLETLSDLPSAEDWAARGPRERELGRLGQRAHVLGEHAARQVVGQDALEGGRPRARRSWP